MKVAIVGSRTFNDYVELTAAIRASGFEITEVVCGEAGGADTLGRLWAERNNIPVASFPAEWTDLTVPGAVVRHNGRGYYNATAGVLRNKKMAEYCQAVIACWDGSSKGTRNMLHEAGIRGKPIYVHKFNLNTVGN